MNLKPLYFILIIFWLYILATKSINAQVTISTSNTIETPAEYYLNVKQFAEFIDRFNYTTDWKGNVIDQSFAEKYSRKAYIGYLLNADDKRFMNDTAYKTLCDTFISKAVNPDKPFGISLYSNQVTAVAKVNIEYLGKPQVANISFVPEVLPDKSVKWVISSVEANCFTNISDSLLKYFISPNSHETGFINLKRIENVDNPVYYFDSNITANPTILFMTETAAKRLTIKNIEKVSYKVNFPGWKITVNEFVRIGYNSGWLISNLEQSQ